MTEQPKTEQPRLTVQEEGSTIRRTARTVGRGIRAVGRAYRYSLIGDTRDVTQAAAALRARMRHVLHAGENARHETFAEACERLGLAAEDVVRRGNELQMVARMLLVVAGVALAVFGYLPWSAHPVSHGLLCFLVLALALARYSVVRWRQAQCELCELMPYLSYWWQWWRA